MAVILFLLTTLIKPLFRNTMPNSGVYFTRRKISLDMRSKKLNQVISKKRRIGD